MAKLDAAIDPGLTMLNWTSLNLATYLDSVYEALRELDLLLTRAQDLVTFRIDGVLNEMSVVPLCELPSDASWTVEEFLKNTEVVIALSCAPSPAMNVSKPCLN
jgi:dynein heavy chain